jgi:hypothetical protein
MKTMKFVLILKSLLRAAIDSCILPGTTSGTEILWLYTMQWKKEFSALCFAFLSLLTLATEPAASEMLIQQPLTERESAS